MEESNLTNWKINTVYQLVNNLKISLMSKLPRQDQNPLIIGKKTNGFKKNINKNYIKIYISFFFTENKKCTLNYTFDDFI